MDIESINNCEELIKILGDRIEDLERILYDDEDFCNQDIDATYQAALKYIKSFEEKFHEKLNELKIKLDQIRQDNINISKQNKQQFDNEIEEINQLFSSGKHQEALEKFQNYEKRFEQRTTIIQNIPQLYMNDIDINKYFSIDKPINIPLTTSNDDIKKIIKTQNYFQKTTQTDFIQKDINDINEYEINKSFCSIHSKSSDNQQIFTNNTSKIKETKSSSSTTTPLRFNFSTRLLSSPNNKSLPVTERDISTPSFLSNNNLNSHENITSHMQIQSTPPSPNIIPSLMEQRLLSMNNGRGDTLIFTLVAHYQHERNTSLLMTCNQNYIVFFKNQSDRRRDLCTIERFHQKQNNLSWHDNLILSIGFINKTNIYIFTEYDFIIYSLESFSKYKSYSLLNIRKYNSEYNTLQRGVIGTVHDQYIYHIFLTSKYQWILSIFELEPINHLYDHNLTENFPNVKRFIHICINNKTMCFLVEMENLQYAVIFCSYNHSLIEMKKLIQLSYPENPLTISSIFIHHLQQYFFLVNDPSAKVIHILTNEKYIKSCPIIAYTLYYIEENYELILISNDGIFSTNINEQEMFFSKLN